MAKAPIPVARDVDAQRPTLRMAGRPEAEPAAAAVALPEGEGIGDLVGELLAATGLVAPERLAPVRERAGAAGSVAS